MSDTIIPIGFFIKDRNTVSKANTVKITIITIQAMLVSFCISCFAVSE